MPRTIRIGFPTEADAKYAAERAAELREVRNRWVKVRLDGAAIELSDGNGRERDNVDRAIAQLRAPAENPGETDTRSQRPARAARPDDPPATPRQIAFIQQLADRDPGLASTFGVGPLVARDRSWATSLSKTAASRIIDNLLES